MNVVTHTQTGSKYLYCFYVKLVTHIAFMFNLSVRKQVCLINIELSIHTTILCNIPFFLSILVFSKFLLANYYVFRLYVIPQLGLSAYTHTTLMYNMNSLNWNRLKKLLCKFCAIASPTNTIKCNAIHMNTENMKRILVDSSFPRTSIVLYALSYPQVYSWNPFQFLSTHNFLLALSNKCIEKDANKIIKQLASRFPFNLFAVFCLLKTNIYIISLIFTVYFLLILLSVVARIPIRPQNITGSEFRSQKVQKQQAKNRCSIY